VPRAAWPGTRLTNRAWYSAPVEPVREAVLDPLMGRLARGDRSAFDLLYSILRPRALRFAEAKLGRSEAADVAQTALLKVFSRASDFTPGRPCLPWFYAIVANEIRAAQRQGLKFKSDDGALENAADQLPSAEDQLLSHELERALTLAIESLDQDAANAIAAMLGMAPLPSVNNVTLRKRVSRAYAKLRLILRDQDAD
jgi:RNA polymerase sigma factor (sigma-70 family)